MDPIAIIQMKDGSAMRVVLYADKAPNTVANFAALCRDGFYDGLTFHRVVKGFIAQSGAPNGRCEGNEAPFFIKGEFAENGCDTGIKHEHGVISMARRRGFDTASTQFFLVDGNAARLDGKYAAFGRITDAESLTVLERLMDTPVNKDMEDMPLTPQIIETITIETTGDIAAPDRLPPIEN